MFSEFIYQQFFPLDFLFMLFMNLTGQDVAKLELSVSMADRVLEAEIWKKSFRPYVVRSICVTALSRILEKDPPSGPDKNLLG